MSYKSEMVKQAYDALIPKYRELESIVDDLLTSSFSMHGLKVVSTPHRIKTWESVYGKLMRKPETYSSTKDLNDLLGFRVICFFASHVDVAASIIKQLFEIDSSRSRDKRSLLSPTTFGYLSLHYICTLKPGSEYPEDLKSLRFEIQIRSALQHVWAEIEHDLGYKTVLEVPRDIRREFSRVAGLLEVADESFDRIRTRISEYETDTLRRIEEDSANHLTVDRFSLIQFIRRSNAMKQLFSDMSRLTEGEITYARPDGYLPLLEAMKIRTLGDLHELITGEHEHAIELLSYSLQFSDLEELTSNSVLFYLCRARLIWGDYNEEQIRDIMYSVSKEEKKIRRSVDYIMRMRNHFLKKHGDGSNSDDS